MDAFNKLHQRLHALISGFWRSGKANLLPGSAAHIGFAVEALETRTALSAVGAPFNPEDSSIFMVLSSQVDMASTAPRDVAASTGDYSTLIRVAWKPVASATAYEVWRSQENNPAAAQHVATVQDPLFENTAVEAGKPYFYWVKAKNAAGISPLSQSGMGYRTCPLTLPAPLSLPAKPTQVAASQGEFTTQVCVTWAIVSNAASYEVWRGSTNNFASATKHSDVTANVFEDTGARPLRRYFYWVRAKNSAGVSGFGEITMGYRLGVAPPAAPIGITATQGDFNNQVRVTWDASAGATSYEVWRSTISDPASAAKWTEVDGTVFENTSVEAGVIYHYWVKARNEAGVSAMSTTVIGWKMVVNPL